MAEVPTQAIEQDIAHLEQQILQKRSELEQMYSSESAPTPSDRELIHQAIGQQIQQQSPSTPAPATSPMPALDLGAVSQAVQQLQAIAFGQGVTTAVAAALATHNPAVIDAFHDAITDDLHQQLVERKLLQTP